ncbi:MAG: glycosyltransferase family 9 protein [Simkaniaceae bacterium]|nr:glycosyltransferase family 9 protein [Candidatus Sacchlamyda saccharinae]
MIVYSPKKLETYYRLKGYFLKQSPPPNKEPTSILLSNQGSLGDVFLTTCLIPSLKEKYPKAKIGLLIDPAASVAADNCPGVDEIYKCASWFCHLDNKWKKLGKRALFKRPKLDYDWVIQTDPYYRGMGSSLKHIPKRTCFSTTADKIYFNDVIPFTSTYLAQLLQLIAPLKCPWPASTKSQDYVLFHLGPSSPDRELPVAFWQDLYDSYQSQGQKVLFSGSSEREREMIEQIAPFTPTTFAEFVQKIAGADHIVTVDTVTVHIAHILKKNTYAFFRKPTELWVPPAGENLIW